MCSSGGNGWYEVKKLETVIGKSDIVITATGNRDIVKDVF